MTDAEIVKAVREGTHTLVPMPVGDRKWFVGCYGDAEIVDDALVLILDLEDCEGEEICGLMMGGLTAEAVAAQEGLSDNFDRSIDDRTPF